MGMPVPEDTKKKIAMALKVAMLEMKFEDDIVKEAVRLGLDPVRELKIAIKVLNDVKEDGDRRPCCGNFKRVESSRERIKGRG